MTEYSLEKRSEPSLVQRVKDYFFPEKPVPDTERTGFTEVNSWVDHAFKEAREGKSWSGIESSLRIAKKQANEAGINLDVDMEKLKATYKTGLINYGQNNVDSWVDYVFKEAREGTLWSSIESGLRVAKKYANEADIKLDVDMEKLKATYKTGVINYGQKNVDQWVDLAFKEAKERKQWDSIETDLRIAKKYANEAGIKLEKNKIRKKLKAIYLGKDPEKQIGNLSLVPEESGQLSLTTDYGQLTEVEENE